MNNNNDVNIKITADAAQAKRELRDTSKAVGSLENKTKGASDTVDQLAGSFDDAADSSGSLRAESDKAADSISNIKKISAIAATAVAGFFTLSTSNLITFNRELLIAEKQLGVTSDQLQIWQLTSERFNISGEKMRDILKDVSDKLGDFARFGAGEAKDIIEALNLDIQELINMRPDEALLKIAHALNQASDLSHVEKLSLLEKLANDASLLLPMLENNAQALKDVAASAAEKGLIITPEESVLLSQADQNLIVIKESLSAVKQEAALVGAEFVVAFGDNIASAIDSIKVENLKQVAEHASFAAGAIATLYVATNAAKWVLLLGTAAATMQARMAAATGGMVGMRLVMDALTTRAIAGTVAMRGLTAAMTLLGGPLGIAIIAAASFAYLASKVQEERDMIELSNGSHVSLAGAIDIATEASERYQVASKSKRAEIRAEIQTLIIDTKAHLDNARAVMKAAQARAAALKADIKRSGTINTWELSSDGKGGLQAVGDALEAELDVTDIEDTLSELESKFANLKTSAESVGKTDLTGFTGNLEKVNEALGKNKEGTKGAASAKNSLASAADRASQAFENEKNRLKEQHILLTEGEPAAYKFAKSLSDLNETEIAELQTMQAVNEALAKQQELREQVQQAYQQEMQSLDDQYAKLTLNERAYKAYELQSKKLPATLQREVLARYDAVEATKKQVEANQRLIDESNRLFEGIGNNFIDALLDKDKSMKDAIKASWNDLKDFFKRNILQPMIQPIMGAVSNAFTGFLGIGGGGAGMPAGINPAGGGGLGGLGSLTSLFTKGKAMLFGNQIGQGIASMGGKIGTSIFAKAGGVSNLAYGGAGLLGGLFGQAAFGGKGGIGGGLGSMAGLALGLGPWGAIGGALLGGGLGGLFGRKKEKTGSGLQVAFDDDGRLTAKKYTTWKKGGFLNRKKGTDYEDAPDELVKALQDSLDNKLDALKDITEYFGYSGAQGVVNDFLKSKRSINPAQSLAVDDGFKAIKKLNDLKGKSVDAIKNSLNDLSNSFGSAAKNIQNSFNRIDLDGLDEKEAQEKINEWLNNTVSGLYRDIVGSDFDKYAKAGESLSETMERLFVNVKAVTSVTENLSVQFGLVGKNAIEASNSLIELFGGIDEFMKQTSFYYDNYYTDEEKADNAIRSAAKSVADINVENDTYIRTKEQLRDFVDSLDLTTEAGQRAFKSAMKLAPALDQLDKSLKIKITQLKEQYSEKIDAYNRLQDIALGLRETLSNLRFSSGSAFTQKQRHQTLEETFNHTISLALDGDESAAKRVSSLGNDYIAQSKNESSTLVDFQRSQAYVSHSMDDVASGIEAMVDPQKELNEEIKRLVELTEDEIRNEELFLRERIEQATIDQEIQAEQRDNLLLANENLTTLPDRNALALKPVLEEAFDSIDINIPGYASGGYHAGGLRVVGEHGPELEFTAPSRIFNAADTRQILKPSGSNDAQTTQELRQLRAENKQLLNMLKMYLSSIAQNSAKSSRIQQRWEHDGMPEARTAG